MERRLSAIMVADVVGFSRLMRSNEVGTLQALKAHRSELVDGKITEYSGRIVKHTGDGFIAEFSSVLNATNCAVEIQTNMELRNVDIPQDRCLEFRIGINAGDIIHDDGDVFGDGVNVAARIESLARPGGVAVTGSTREQMASKTDLVFEDAGTQTLKNIDQPVQIYHVIHTANDTGPAKVASPRELSVAVLPFVNMSGDSEQEYFADGITEDLITDLSKISALFVVGRNSVFTYKGKSVNLIQAARELGVKFLLEGSVRKSGQKVRITAQFIDGATGGHLWADRYDRDLTDIFALQDEITQTIVDQLQIKLGAAETGKSSKAPTQNMDAYSYYLKGRQYYHQRTRRLLKLGRQMFEKAVELDPGFARAFAGIADCNSFANSWYGADASFDEVLATTNKAITLEPNLAEAHAAKGFALLSAGRQEEAAQSLQHALSIDPLCYESHYYYARYCVLDRNYERAAVHFIRALEIRPDDYRSPLLLHSVLKDLGRIDERREYIQLGLKRAEIAAGLHSGNTDPWELGAATLAANGELTLARKWLDRALAIREDSESPSYNVACTYAGLGEFDSAIDVLEGVLEVVGPDGIQWIKADSDMNPLREHPRFQKLMRKWT